MLLSCSAFHSKAFVWCVYTHHPWLHSLICFSSHKVIQSSSIKKSQMCFSFDIVNKDLFNFLIDKYLSLFLLLNLTYDHTLHSPCGCTCLQLWTAVVCDRSRLFDPSSGSSDAWPEVCWSRSSHSSQEERLCELHWRWSVVPLLCASGRASERWSGAHSRSGWLVPSDAFTSLSKNLVLLSVYIPQKINIKVIDMIKATE